MNNKLLYFPYIDIPENNWTVKSLLYWDKVGIIVPQQFIEEPNQYKKFTVDLLKTDLIEPIFPYEFTSQSRTFDDGFIQLINQPHFNIEKRRSEFLNNKFSRIHIQKFGKRLLEYLVELHIAKVDETTWDWYFVETKTANLIMLYLATYIGKIGNFTPATDKEKRLNLSVSQNFSTLQLDRIRQKIIDDLLPYPIEPNLTKLRKFKDKYHEELNSFRIMLEQDVLYTSNFSKDKEDIAYNLKMAEINDKRAKILSDLNDSKIGQITFGTVCGLIGAVIGFSQGNQAVGTFSFLNAVHSALQGYGNNEILQRDYSYLALIDKELK